LLVSFGGCENFFFEFEKKVKKILKLAFGS